MGIQCFKQFPGGEYFPVKAIPDSAEFVEEQLGAGRIMQK